MKDRDRILGPTSSPRTTMGSPHAWVQTTGGSVPSVLVSFGVGSITDAGIGLLDVTFAVPFGGANYTAVGIVQNTAGAVNPVVTYLSNTTVPTATASRMAIVHSSSGALADVTTGGLNVLFFGEAVYGS